MTTTTEFLFLTSIVRRMDGARVFDGARGGHLRGTKNLERQESLASCQFLPWLGQYCFPSSSLEIALKDQGKNQTDYLCTSMVCT